MFTTLAIISMLGIVALSSGENGEKQVPQQVKFDKEFCRKNLKESVFDNWNCQDIAYQLQDNWLKDDVNYLLRNGYTFQRAIEELVEKGQIKL